MKKSRLEQTFDAAVAHHQSGRFAEAEAGYRKVLAEQANHADALHLLGVLAAQFDRYDDAVSLISKACTLTPNVASYQMHLGNALGGKKDYPASIEAYQKSIRLDPSCAIAFDGIGAALRELGQFEQAVASHQRAIQITPNHSVPHYNLGLTFATMRRFNEALVCYRRAIALDPNYAEAHWNMALMLLSLGDFAQGWREYEWRWRRRHFLTLWPKFPQPQWNDEDISGKTILIHTEQGYGDAAQFVRYAPLLASRGARVVFLCQAPLLRLLSAAHGVAQAVTTVQALPPFDVQCPMMSVPLIFGTQLHTIPNAVPYLNVDPELSRQWAERVGDSAGRLKIGLAWAGSPTNKNDLLRSIRLDQFAPLATSGAKFYSLQKGPASSQSANPPPGMELTDLTTHIEDFADTAAFISQLDLVITVDTAVAHIAGGLAKPAWVLIATEQDWRWLRNCDDSPWYPTLRLFRQVTPDQWPPVIERVAGALANLRGQRAIAVQT